MAIKVRRGLKEEFIPAKLLPGEFAVATDTGAAWYCYNAGKVIQIATSEDITVLRQEVNNIQEENTKILERLKESINEELVNVENAVRELDDAQNSLQLLLDSKIDDAYVENGYLYMTSNNEVVVGPLGPFSGTGGG